MIRLAIALAAAASLALPAGTAGAGDAGFLRDDGTLRYRFYTDWELLYVERDRTPDVEVSFLNQPGDPDFREVLGTDAVVDDDEELGGRAVLGFRFDERSAVEVVFSGWAHEREATKRSIPDQDLFAFENPDLGLLPNVDDGEFDGGAIHDLDYDSDFYSGELNYRHQYGVDGVAYRFNLLAGLRALRLEEDLDFTSYDGPTIASGVGTYNIATRNTLVGGQLGIETLIPLWQDRVELDLYGVAGGYANQAKVYIEYADVDATPTLIRQSRSEWDVAGVFEAAAHVTVRVWRGIRIKGGYRALYLVNIAAAPDQFARSGAASDFFGNSYDNDGNTVFHGPSLGVSVDF